MKLLLHCCCAPCSGAILEYLLKEGIKPAIYFCNPNIFPEREYIKRKTEIERYCNSLGVDFTDDDYDHSQWLEAIRGHENDPERGERCSLCFHFRLLSSARYAIANGYDTLATTLASSRWKNLEQVNEAGSKAVQQALAENASTGQDAVLQWWNRNWRKGGLQERRDRIIKEQGFYNQNWCGCEFSHKADE